MSVNASRQAKIDSQTGEMNTKISYNHDQAGAIDASINAALGAWFILGVLENLCQSMIDIESKLDAITQKLGIR